MKVLQSACLLFLTVACTNPGHKAEGDTWNLTGFRVAAVSPNPQPSGILSTFVEIEAAVSDSDSQTLYLQYLGGDQFVPRVGMICDAYGELAFINGESSISSPIERRALHQVVDQISCE